ncbi:MAG: protein-glutamate O-methyltransferase CheR [Bacteroidales bacterium]|nr:protein-glutamate O-methyltransferase CheR [Bacteroidales bacterium]
MHDRLKYYKTKLSDNDFIKISEHVERKCGIRLPRQKKAMVQNRLYKRLIEIEISTFEEYVKFVFSSKGNEEVNHMIDEITTNKTDFFREIKHFNFLENIILKKQTDFKIWSAGCSTGEEPYTIAMILDKNLINYNIVASDLSEKVLDVAQKGVYKPEVVKNMQLEYLQKYFDKIEENNKELYKIKFHLKKHIKFLNINLKDQTYNISQNFDIIFFRNVLIYFNIEVQNEILTKILKHLKIGGYLFIGHSESIYNLKLPLKSVSHSVFQKINT